MTKNTEFINMHEEVENIKFAGGAVIVETRVLPDINEVIKSHMKFLKNWQLIIFCSAVNSYQFEELKAKGAIVYDNIEVSSLHDYNTLLTKIDFWHKIPHEKVLIFQYDSRLLCEGIEGFIQWDYVGAPWGFQPYGGNGGLSLRTNSVMKIICAKVPYQPMLGYEDIYFCNMMYTLKCGKLAPRDVCAKFSVETIFNTGTIGCHAIEKYLPKEQCDLILNQYENTGKV